MGEKRSQFVQSGLNNSKCVLGLIKMPRWGSPSPSVPQEMSRNHTRVCAAAASAAVMFPATTNASNPPSRIQIRLRQATTNAPSHPPPAVSHCSSRCFCCWHLADALRFWSPAAALPDPERQQASWGVSVYSAVYCDRRERLKNSREEAKVEFMLKFEISL